MDPVGVLVEVVAAGVVGAKSDWCARYYISLTLSGKKEIPAVTTYKNGPGGTRTLMRYYPRGILSPLRLPIPPQALRVCVVYMILEQSYLSKVPVDDRNGLVE